MAEQTKSALGVKKVCKLQQLVQLLPEAGLDSLGSAKTVPQRLHLADLTSWTADASKITLGEESTA